MTTSPDITDTQALTALRHDLEEILRIDALDCDGATTDALLVRAAADSMTALRDVRASADKHAFDAMRADIRVAELESKIDGYLDDAQRAGARVAELEAEAAILRQYAITGATFAGMRDEIILPVGSWPHVGKFAAFLAGAVTMHRRMSGEQEAPNHLAADGRNAAADPKPGDVWVINGRPWIVKRQDPRLVPVPNVKPEIELENCDSRRIGKSISRAAWALFVAPHTFVRNLNEPTQPPIDESDPDRPSLAQVG